MEYLSGANILPDNHIDSINENIIPFEFALRSAVYTTKSDY